MILLFLGPSVEDWLVLILIIGAREGECVLYPYDKALPMPSSVLKGAFKVHKLARCHTNVQSAVCGPNHIR